MWDPQLPALVDAGYRVVRSDMRGYGDSPLPDRPYDNAQDVIDLLDQLGAEEFALVGSSGGGRLALEIAARRPHRVTSLALLCTALGGHEPSAELQAFGEREDALLEAGDVAGATELNVELWLGPHADEATREQVREMQRHAFEVQLAAVEEFPQIRPTSTSPTSPPPPCWSPAITTCRTSARSRSGCRRSWPTPGSSNSTGRATCPAWNGPRR